MKFESELEEIWKKVKPRLFSAACSLLTQELSNGGVVHDPLRLNQVEVAALIEALSVLRTASESKFNEQEREWMLLFEAWLRVRRVFLTRRQKPAAFSESQLFAVV